MGREKILEMPLVPPFFDSLSLKDEKRPIRHKLKWRRGDVDVDVTFTRLLVHVHTATLPACIPVPVSALIYLWIVQCESESA